MTVLEGRVALVTGSARGIGAAIADRLARDGAAVAINYLNSKQEAEAVAERIRKAGGNATVIRADIGDPAQARSLVESTVRKLGRLDILVNNAGITMMAPIEAIDQEQIRRQLTVNVEGPIFTVRAAQGYLPSQGGRVINITGNVQLHPVPGHLRLRRCQRRDRRADSCLGQGTRPPRGNGERRRARPNRD